MDFINFLKRLLPGKSLNEVQDLSGWRSYYIQIMIFFALLAMPVGLAFALPSYVSGGRWEVIIFDVIIIAVLALILLLRKYVPFIKIFFLLLYGIAVTFIIFLGPYHVRPAWLIMCVVSAAFLFGIRAAFITTAINFLFLMFLYFYASPYLNSWAIVHQEPFRVWVNFCANLSILSLLSGVPVGFLLSRMDRLLIQEKELSRQLSLEREGLKSANFKLQEEIVQRNRAEAETKRLEFELRQAQKMEAIGTMAGGIAHDFNNILTIVIGYSQLILNDPEISEENHSQISEVMKAGERARDLVKQLLAFSRKGEISIVPLDLSETVGEALKMMRALIPANISLHTNLAESCMILSSSTYIHQIVMNLCNNAIHAMGTDGGSLNISLSRKSIDKQEAVLFNIPAGEYFRLSVSDTGKGMSPEVTARIFEPYFTTKGLSAGTGLGLSVVHGIVKNHYGAIECRSIENEGTTFDIYLPEIKNGAVDAEIIIKDPHSIGTESVLYVDDETKLVVMAEKMLTSLGYNVVSCTNSMEAIELFTRDPSRFDIVITDMAMPYMTGDELARKILAIRPEMPVIICTGYSEHMSGEKAGEYGIRGFLMKPYDIGRLSRAVRYVLDGNILLHEKNLKPA